MKKKLLCLIFLFVFILSDVSIIDTCASELAVSAECAVLMCVDNGEILYAKNADLRRPMASTTKIMTSLLALEAAQYGNKQVTVTEKMYAEGSSMYLKAGDILTLKDLAAGMMMVSGNDSANAVALSLADSLEAFAKIMNEKAREIGMNDTSFVTPSGLDDENHYSTAHDMALLMSYAMKNADFAELTGKKQEQVRFINPKNQIKTYSNHNKLLKTYKYCIGGKTGFTKIAGRCLVSCAQKSGVTLVAVTLNAPDDWNDHKSMYDYGFGFLESVSFEDFDITIPIDVVGGCENIVNAVAENSSRAVLPKNEKEKVERTVKLVPFIYAPVTAGDTVGSVTYMYNDEIIAVNYLVADKSCEYMEVEKSFFERIADFFKGLFT